MIMEDMAPFITIVLFVFGILQIILFFKIWGMTNDIRAMKNKFFEIYTNKSNIKSTEVSNIKEQENKNKSNNNININNTDDAPWCKNVTEEEIEKAKSIIPSLRLGEVIIKLTKKDKFIVYDADSLHELVDEDYKIIYIK